MKSWTFASRFQLPSLTPVLATLGLCVVAIVAVLAPALAPFNPNLQDISQRLLPPLAPGHLLGTDQLGRDILSRLIYGSRISLTVGFVSVALGSSIGTLLGLCAGYFGGLVDDIIRWLMNVFLAFPFILLVITVVAVFGSSAVQLVVILGLVSWTDYAKVLRAEVLSVRERDFVTAARSTGATNRVLMFRHILPNAISPLIVLGSFDAARLIIVAAALDFLGLGVPANIPSWGSMLSDGRAYMQVAWWLATIPGIAIMLIVICLNVLGDWLRDRTDPRSRAVE